MSKLKIDISKFKHLSTDGKSTTLQHPDGHQITISHAPLSKDFKAQLEAMAPKAGAKQSDKQLHNETKQQPAMMADGGDPGVPAALSPDQPPQPMLGPVALQPQFPMEAPAVMPGPMATAVSPESQYGATRLPWDTMKGETERPARGEREMSKEEQDKNQPKSLLEQMDKSFPADDAAMPNDQIAQRADAESGVKRPGPQDMFNAATSAQFDPNGVYNAAQGAYGSEAKAIGDLGKENAAIAAKRQQDLAAQQAHEQNILQQSMSHIEDAIKATQGPDAQIKPNHYLENMSTGQKITSAIGLILGGIGGGLTHQENPALKYLNQQIDRDIESQKANLGQKNNVLAAYQHLYGDNAIALNMARATQNGIYAAKIEQAAAKAQGPMARAKAQEAMVPFLQQKQQYLQQAAMLQSLANPNPTTGMNENDPASYVARIVPEHAQKQVNAEIESAQNTVHNAPAIMKAFDNAANHVHGVDFVPGIQNADQKTMHALLGPTFKDIEGTVRQAAMENMFNNTTPQFGDSKDTIAKKRAALMGYITSKSSAPTAKNFGIDLQKFRSTNTKQFEQAAQPQYKTYKGKKYMQGPNGEAIEVK